MISKLLLALFMISVCPTVHSGRLWQQKMQVIPGKVECELYDAGGEGIAYHDTDSVNNGSGKLNPANGNFLNEFRMKEGVDISYTKSNGVDDNPFNTIMPEMNRLYVGWTQPGEWMKYTVNVKETGTYMVTLMYTANGNGVVDLELDGKNLCKLNILSTHNDADTIAWRQWHHWNTMESLSKIEISKGVHVLTLYVKYNGNMNYDYLEFKKQ